MLYNCIITQNVSFFDKKTSSDLDSVLTNNVESIKLVIGFRFADFINLISRGVGCFIFSMIQAWKFTIIYLSLIPFIILLSALMTILNKKFTLKELRSYEMAGKIAQETLSSIRTVFSLGMQKIQLKNYETALLSEDCIAKKKGFVVGIFNGLIVLLSNVLFGIGIYYGVYLVRFECDKFLPSNIIQSFFSLYVTTFAISQALPFLKEISEAKGAMEKVFEILNSKSFTTILHKEKSAKIENLKGRIEFENVYFSYPQRKALNILNGMSFKIPAGKTIALVGSSGGGKSTIFALLQRFYSPDSGRIKIDGIDLKSIDHDWLRDQMAVVSQEPVLFAISIRENIRLGRLDATDAEIEQAAKEANAHEFIVKTKNKYDTNVGERGAQLSGGQKQRIAIGKCEKKNLLNAPSDFSIYFLARALIRKPKILLLDEATSALDNQSEKAVQDALDKTKWSRTTIIIAHRLITIKNADIIFYISSGCLIEAGNHDELMKLKGEYFKLFEASNLESVSSEDLVDKEKTENKTARLDSEYSSDDENAQLDDSKKRKKKKNFKPFYYEKRLLKLHRADWPWLAIGIFAQSLSSVIQPITSLLFSEIFFLFKIEEADTQRNESLQFMSIIFSFGILGILSNIANSFCFSLVGSRLTRRLRVLMFKSMLRQDMAFHDFEENKPSALTSQLSFSASFCKGLSSEKIKIYVQGISALGFSIVYSLFLNWQLALLMLAFIPISFCSGALSARHSFKTKKNSTDRVENGSKLIIESIENIRTIFSLGLENFFINQFENIYHKKKRKIYFVLTVQAFFYSISNSIVFFIRAVAFSYGYYLIKNGEINIEDIFKIFPMVTFSSMILARSYSQLLDQNLALKSTKKSIRLVDRLPKIDNFSSEGLVPEDFQGNIKFENVFFSYPNNPKINILNGLSLEIMSGTSNALVGPSGCGKSTIISLILRFYDVDKGKIYIDGNDIKKLNLEWLRSNIAVVTQEPILFDRSIFENICLGDLTRSKIDFKEVVEACIKSKIHDKIEKMPQLYETIVGSKGGQFSGGEKQRIAIARALIRKSKLLLFDEATSALDNQSENLVQDAIRKAQYGRTNISIAHKLKTIMNSDKIFFIKNGSVIEEGNHDNLMANRNFYFNLFTNVNRFE
uniref:ATP-binding cassette transporter subfamily B member 1-like X5 protein n=1 Tax=Brachionus koreanus TaxID=1199090 RepID=A0A1J0MMT0_9BILA|nr:ATP-binding cassette transporter subfamily B member 1-like X5 protein [Brachionus koreanus]